MRSPRRFQPSNHAIINCAVLAVAFPSACRQKCLAVIRMILVPASHRQIASHPNQGITTK